MVSLFNFSKKWGHTQVVWFRINSNLKITILDLYWNWRSSGLVRVSSTWEQDVSMAPSTPEKVLTGKKGWHLKRCTKSTAKTWVKKKRSNILLTGTWVTCINGPFKFSTSYPTMVRPILKKKPLAPVAPVANATAKHFTREGVSKLLNGKLHSAYWGRYIGQMLSLLFVCCVEFSRLPYTCNHCQQ